MLILTLLVAAILTFTIKAPKIFLEVPWTFIKVWGPTSITAFLYNVIALCLVFYMFGLLLILSKKMKLPR
ncbi:hypothetical protein [Paenibacillus terrigena]|uniref:hypothetical protein n=1 Tax=Paenibacillus terrigena TaxID=369333 RepID=UPI000379129D|nr:hypothetical protein [Paenibacillus terrigena]